MSRPSARWQAPLVFAVLIGAALALSCRSKTQFVYAAAFLAACAVMYAWGRIGVMLLQRGDDAPVTPGPITAIYFGQFLLLLAITILMPVNRLLLWVSGSSIGLVPLVLAVTAGLVFFGRRALQTSAEGHDLFWHSLIGIGCLGTAVVLYARHLSALGLDLHQHMTWAQHILEQGFIPLTERHTNVISEYPKTFQLLTALWQSAALGQPVGPVAKAMPFLQTALACLAFNEIILGRLTRQGSVRFIKAMTFVAGLVFAIYGFCLVPMLYPVEDLSHTPKYSSGGLLLLPLLLLLFGQRRKPETAFGLFLGSLPLVCTWQFFVHPMVAIQFFVVALPVAVAVAVVLLGKRLLHPLRLKRFWMLLSLSAVLALIFAIQDPWLVGQLGDRNQMVGNRLQAFNIKTVNMAIRDGEILPEVKTKPYAGSGVTCRSLSCAMALAKSSAAAALQKVGRFFMAIKDIDKGPARLMPFQSVNLTAAGAAVLLVFAVLGAVWVIVVAVRWRFGRRRTGYLARLVGGLFAGMIVGSWGHQFVYEFTNRIDAGHSIAELLSKNAVEAGLYLGSGFYWLLFAPVVYLFAQAIGESFQPDQGAVSRSSSGPVERPTLVNAFLFACLACVGVGSPWLLGSMQAGPKNSEGFWDPIQRGDIRALHRIEERISENEAVLIFAENVETADRGDWVVPSGSTAAVLPYTRQKYVFNIYLGYSRYFTGRDLRSALCSPDPKTRARFIEKAGIRWFLLREPDATDIRQVYQNMEICHLGLNGLGIGFPPKQRKKDLFLFPVQPPVFSAVADPDLVPAGNAVLPPGAWISQTFVAEQDGLAGLRLMLAHQLSPTDRHLGDWFLYEVDAQGRHLRRQRWLMVDHINPDADRSIYFYPLRNSAGKRYEFVLKVPSGDSGAGGLDIPLYTPQDRNRSPVKLQSSRPALVAQPGLQLDLVRLYQNGGFTDLEQ